MPSSSIMYPCPSAFMYNPFTHPRVFLDVVTYASRFYLVYVLSRLMCVHNLCISSRYRSIKRRSVKKDPLNAIHRMADVLWCTFYVRWREGKGHHPPTGVYTRFSRGVVWSKTGGVIHVGAVAAAESTLIPFGPLTTYPDAALFTSLTCFL